MEQLQISKRLKEKHNFPLHVDNRPNQKHPLLIELVLDKVFDYLKGQNNATTLAKYRTTCKMWDREIVKLLRSNTQINLSKILAPCPDGLGWTATPGDLDFPYFYDAPYSEVYSFQNVVIMNSCENFKNLKWRNWFRLMGSQVKGLCFSSPFTCFCQNQFLEFILKYWCPNLESLELCNVKCIGSLLFVSSFWQSNKTLICKNLKTLKISVDGQESYSICKNNSVDDPDEPASDIRLKNVGMQLFTERLAKIIYKHGLSSGNSLAFPEIVCMSKDEFELQNLPDLSDDLSENLEGTDGGILGQLLKDTNVEKLEIHNLDNETYYNEGFATFFHLRQNRWKSSLKELELSENLARSISTLHVIAQVKFPLSSIKLRGLNSVLHVHEDIMTRILSYFADTLEHLEFSGPAVQQEEDDIFNKLVFPSLPKLKSFVHENISAYGLSADNVWKSAPNLKTVFLKASSTMVWDAERFFEFTDPISCSAMKELKLLAPINGKQAERILEWFPNLLKIEVILQGFGVDFYGFFEKLEESKVEHLKIDILGLEHPNLNMVDKDNIVEFWKASNIKGLKSLELNNVANLQFQLTPEPFSSAKLKSLKLINFRIYIHEEKEFMRKLPHISSIELVNTVYLKRYQTRSGARLETKIHGMSSI